jgi:hypothetical protein
MRFIVELPVYLKLEVDAPDADAAASTAEEFAVSAQENPSTGRIIVNDATILSAGVVPLGPEEEDRAPDVYVCRGGRLTLVNQDGWLEPFDEDC